MAFPGQDAEELIQKGWLLYNQKRYDDALQAFDQTLAVEPANEEALDGTIFCHRFGKKDYPEAERWIQIALQRLPNNPRFFNQQGWLRYDQKRYDAFEQALAVEQINQAIRLLCI